MTKLGLIKPRWTRLLWVELNSTASTTIPTTGTHSIRRVDIISWELCQILRDNLGSPKEFGEEELDQAGVDQAEVDQAGVDQAEVDQAGDQAAVG